MEQEDRWRYFFEPQEQENPVFKFLHDPQQRPMLITASVMPNCLGIGYKNPSFQHGLFTGLRTEKPNEYRQAIFDQGHEGEGVAVDEWLEKHPDYTGVRPGFVYHKNPLFGATSDFIFCERKTGNLINGEVKCPMDTDISDIENEVKMITKQLNGIKYKEKTNIYRIYKYLLQATMQMAVYNIKTTILIIYIPGQLRSWKFPFSPTLHDKAIELSQNFVRMVEQNIVPQNKPDPELLTLLERVRLSMHEFK